MIKNIFCVIILAFPIFMQAQIFQNLGEHRDGKFNETGLLKVWPDSGPEKILKIDGIGRGWSAAVATDEKILVTGMFDSIDYISAYNFSGNLLWRLPFGRSWENSFPDTRSTPTCEGKKAWVISGCGNMACFNIEIGKKIWSVNVDSLFESSWDIWGVAESPLIVDNLVISVPAGKKGAMVALDKNTGKTVWQSKVLQGTRSYVSPVLYENDQVRLILGMTHEVFFAVNPLNGEIMWTFPFRSRGNELENNGNKWPIYANNPIIVGNKVAVSAGWNYGTILFEIALDGKSIKESWVNRNLDNQQYGIVENEGYIYGSNWINIKNGNWVCVDINNGNTKWEASHHNKGVVISADKKLFLYDEEGYVSLVEPSPEKFKITSQFKIMEGSGQHWAHPYIKDGILFIRHGESLMAYKIK
jgi:outer membrane protein assembly factor BamB